MQQAKQQIIKNVESVKIGQIVGMSFTNNNRQYKIIGKVQKINGNTIKIESITEVGGYEKGKVFTYSFRKSTKQNHVFAIPESWAQMNEIVKEVMKFNANEDKVHKLVTDAVNEFWDQKIAKAEQEQKEQGVYKLSEVSEITGKGLVHKYNTYGVSQ